MFSLKTQCATIVETILGYMKLRPEIIKEPVIRTLDPYLVELLRNNMKDYEGIWRYRLVEVLNVVRTAYENLQKIDDECNWVNVLLVQ
jgi:hypothetical protein